MNEETEIVHNRARIICRRQVEDMKRNLLRQQEDDNYQTILAVRIREDVDIRKARTAEEKDLLHTENTIQEKHLCEFGRYSLGPGEQSAMRRYDSTSVSPSHSSAPDEAHPAVETDLQPSQSSTTLFRYSFCDTNFDEKIRRNRHEKKHLPQVSNHRCNEAGCKKFFASRSTLRKHIRSIQRRTTKYTCHKCQMTFYRSDCLKRHPESKWGC